MSLKNRLAKLIIDPAFRNPGLMQMIFEIDDATGIDLVKTLSPFKLMPASAELFQRSFAHFVAGEEISYACATGLAAIAPDPVSKRYLLIQAGEEMRHLNHFNTKLQQFGLGETRIAKFVSPGFKKFGETIQKRVEAGDYVSAMVGNNVIVEGLAICLLELGCRELRDNSDEISKFLDFVLEDERHHVRFGEKRLKAWNTWGLVDERQVADFYGEMWSYVVEAINDIPDVVESMGLKPAALLRDAKAYFEARFAGADLAITA